MFNPKTGRLSWGKSKALWPGMTHGDFAKTSLFKRDLLSSVEDFCPNEYRLKNQKICGSCLSLRLRFDQKGFLCDILLTQPEFDLWPDWPKEVEPNDYLRIIKERNDRFLSQLFKRPIDADREHIFAFDWGYITSSHSFLDSPDARITFSIDVWRYDPTFIQSDQTVLEMMGWGHEDFSDSGVSTFTTRR